MFWRFNGLVLVLGLLPAFAVPNSGIIQVTGIRSWSHADSTRVIIETTGPFEFKSDRAFLPDRLFIDIANARPLFAGRRTTTKQIGDRLVQRVRAAELTPRTTRIVFDLAAPAEMKITKLDAPDRLVVELRPTVKPTVPSTYVSSLARVPSAVPATPVMSGRPAFIYPPRPLRAQIYVPPAPFIPASSFTDPLGNPSRMLASVMPPKSGAHPVSTKVLAVSRPAVIDAPPLISENATRSLIRALGLKISRVVIDAGHGGHDDGTIGPHGVLEKDVVLDVALRLSKLIQERMGAEVVLTRSDDTFIPLHERTNIANDKKADLFISIHANSSPAPDVAGTETFFLNFTTSGSALDVAARENAGADKNVGELKDLIQSITLNDKIEESKTLAQDIQTNLYAQAAKTNLAAKDRGVKRAPFVVLIGAGMPSILAEIGFLSNSRDESNLNKPEYRQKIADSLFKGVTKYSQSLSHFDLSARKTTGGTVTAGLDQ